MRNLITAKPNECEMAENNRALDLFICAMMGCDTLTIESLLLPNRKYFGRYNKYQVIAILSRKFNKLGTGYITGTFNMGVSLSSYPGSVAIEFKWAKVPEGYCEIEDPNPLEGPDVIKLNIILVFQKGKIADIIRAKNNITLEKACVMAREN